MDFEKKLAELESITNQLEGNVSIEEGIALFERSLVLAKDCAEYLEASKGKIVLLKKEMDKLTEPLE